SLYFVLPGLKILIAIFLVYMVYVFFREVSHMRRLVTRGETINYKTYDFLCGIVLNEYYEKWQPLIVLCLFMFTVPLLRPLLVFHLVIFGFNTARFYTDYWFFFLLIILPVKKGIQFVYHHGILKAATLIYYNLKHVFYWNVYMPLKKGRTNDE
ncbi:MAG: hypothetical protein JWO06_3076, partial [Bacteroidota bacterium]|nr:hypothetical protein [Bacteroidota bacterium]